MGPPVTSPHCIAGLQSMVEGKMSDFVSCHGPVVVNSAQTVAFLCDEPGNHTVSRLELQTIH